MKPILATIFGFAAFVLFVVQPMRANLIASLATSIGINNDAQALLLTYANQIDPCSVGILNKLGDAHLLEKNYHMAAYAYGRAMACSPYNAVLRFKYGEVLLMMGELYGAYMVIDAAKLEPNNPLYKGEFERLSHLLAQSGIAY